MGIVKGIFGTKISGKVGSVVFRNNGAVNTISEKPANVKNPRTDAQQAQRMCMTTINAAYKQMKAICDHSYEGISYGGASMNYFMKENSKIVQLGKYGDNVQFNAKGNVFALPNKYLMSKGSLPALNVVNDNGVSFATQGIGIEITLNSSSVITNTITVKEFCDWLGVDLGDQITICVLGGNDNVAFNLYGVEQRETLFVYARIIFAIDAGDKTLLTEGKLNTDALDTEKSENVDALTFSVSTGSNNASIIVAGNFSGDADVMPGACIIRSKKVGNTWQRSTQYMAINTNGILSSYQFANVLKTYEPTGEKYLNNAEQ